jgi:DNA-binding beta-propeller fold protein YncE
MVVAVDGAPEGVAVTDSGTVAVNVRDAAGPGGGLLIFPIASPATAGATAPVALGGSARHLTLAGPDGPALVADESDDHFLSVALPGGQVLASVKVGSQPHEAIAVGADTYFVFDELANTIHIVRGNQVLRVVPAPLQPGGGALADDQQHVVAVGVRGRQITEYTPAGDLIGSADCGAGPTHVITGEGGLFWVNDTDGDAVLGFRLTERGPRQVAMIQVGAGAKPYGIAYDTARHTLWVTLTGRNQLLGLTLDDITVTRRTTYDTVRQPNTVAVDERTGQLVVTGSLPGTGGHLQFLP